MSHPIQTLLEDIGILKVHVTNSQDMMPKAKKDSVVAFKTFQSAFPGAVGFQPEIVLPHNPKRTWAQIWNNGSPFVTAPAPSTPNGGSVLATGVAQQNLNAYPVQVVIAANGATITNVSVNGITVGTAAGTYAVPAFGAISVAYTVATPTWVWSNPASSTGNANIYVCSSIADAQASTPIGSLLQPGQHLDIREGTTEAYIVANGSGSAPLVNVVSVNEQ